MPTNHPSNGVPKPTARAIVNFSSAMSRSRTRKVLGRVAASGSRVPRRGVVDATFACPGSSDMQIHLGSVVLPDDAAATRAPGLRARSITDKSHHKIKTRNRELLDSRQG
jgi:hypothetical protein